MRSTFAKAVLALRITNYRTEGGGGRVEGERRKGKLTIIVTAIHLVGHVSGTVEPFVAPLMQRDAVAVIARPLVRAAPTAISFRRPIVAAQFIAIVVRAIDSAIAMLMPRYALTALARPLVGRAPRPLIFSFISR